MQCLKEEIKSSEKNEDIIFFKFHRTIIDPILLKVTINVLGFTIIDCNQFQNWYKIKGKDKNKSLLTILASFGDLRTYRVLPKDENVNLILKDLENFENFDE